VSGGYAGAVRSDVSWTQIQTALQKGKCVNNRTNVKIFFEGEVFPLITFEGRYWTASGQLSFWHHESRVMHVDFDRDRVTDFGYTGYSMTTDRNLNGWRYALQAALFVSMRSLDGDAARPFDWTKSDRYNKRVVPNRGAGFAEDMFKRFAAGVPWVSMIDGSPWFCGQAYDHNLVRQYDKVRHEIVGDGVSWHWFTGDWVDGRWEKRFIDDAAKARWQKREAKMGRTAA